MNIFIDFETFSPVDIALGPRAYVSHPEFRPLLLSWAVDRGPVKTTRKFSELVSELTAREVLFIAHNAPFDRAVFEKVYGQYGMQWHDTAAVCRYLSVPASLDGASQFFGLGRKVEAGKGLIKKINSGEELTKAEWKEFERYGKQDVILCRKLFYLFEKERIELDPFAKKVHALHEDMNALGLRVDEERTGKLFSVIQGVRDKARADAEAKFGTYKKGSELAPIASSADRVKRYLRDAGHPVESIAEKDLEDFLQVSGSKLPKKALELLAFFREIQSRGADKLQKIFTNHLTRVYDSSTFHGTHTGRPAGGGINLLNVKRAGHGDDDLPFEKSLVRIMKTAKPGEKVKRLSSLLWGCFAPERGGVVVRSDLSAIEPRVGAWLRNDQKTLEIYRKADAGEGKDEYTIFGEAMRFPKAIARNLSKIVILAACYGMSGPRFRVQCRSWGMPDPGEAKAEEILQGYHRANPSVKRTWFDLIKAAVGVIENRLIPYKQAWQVNFFSQKIGGKLFLRLTLPSGRIKSYADVKIEIRGGGWKTFTYLNPLKNYRETVPAAGLYENIVQAVAVDVSFQKAFEMPRTPSLIIHDELNIPATARQVSAIAKKMKTPVSWLPGMPVNSKTVVCSSYHKGDRIK